MRNQGQTKFPRFSLLALLAGCTAVGPDYQRPAIDLPQEYPVPQTATTAAVGEAWWTLYQDRTLDELVSAARKSNVDVRLAAARVREAEALARETNAAFFPDVTAGASAARSRVSNRVIPAPQPGVPLERSQYQLSASTSFELDFWGRFARASEAAQANLLGSRFNQDVVGLTLAGSTAQAYFALRSLDAQIEVADATIRVRRESLGIAKTRAEAGLA